MNTKKIAIIGTGNISKAHVKAIRSLPERAKLVASMDIDPTRAKAFSETHQIPAFYTSTEELMEKEKPDLVHICTPPSIHSKLIQQCLKAGAWVYCEKPLCGSLKELDEIEEAERLTGNYCSCVFQWRFGSGVQHLRQLIQSNSLGKPLLGICSATWYRAKEYHDVAWRGTWKSELGGTTMVHGIHLMDMFLWIMGDWSELSAMIATLDRSIEVETVSLAMAKFENGAMGSFQNSSISPNQESSIRWDFQKGTVELKAPAIYHYTNEDWKFSLPSTDKTEVPAEWTNLPPNRPSSHATQLEELLNSMDRNERPLVSGPEARRTLEFITCLYKSAYVRGPVKRGSITPDDPFYHHVGGSWLNSSATPPSQETVSIQK